MGFGGKTNKFRGYLISTVSTLEPFLKGAPMCHRVGHTRECFLRKRGGSQKISPFWETLSRGALCLLSDSGPHKTAVVWCFKPHRGRKRGLFLGVKKQGVVGVGKDARGNYGW